MQTVPAPPDAATGSPLVYYLRLFRSNWLLLALLSSALTLAVYLTLALQTPIYRAEALLLTVNGMQAGNSDIAAIQVGEQLAESYAERLSNRDVLAAAAAQVGSPIAPDELRDALRVVVLPRTELLWLSVDHPDPQLAAALANAIPTIFAERNRQQQAQRYASAKQYLTASIDEVQAALQASELTLAQALADNDAALAAQTNVTLLRLRETLGGLLADFEDVRIAEATTLNDLLIDEAAIVPQKAVSPRVLRGTLLGAAVSVLLSSGLMLLRDTLDDTVRDPAALSDVTGLPILGQIPRFDTEKEWLVTVAKPRSAAAEAFRSVRLNLRYSAIDHELRAVMVTSAGPGEGKSTLTANLACAFAHAGRRTIVVDGDMRRPMVHRALAIENRQGLSTLFAERGSSTERIIQPTGVPNLSAIAAGPLPPNPSILLDSARAATIVQTLRRHYEMVLIDTPAMIGLSDAAALSQHVDGVVLLVRLGQTRFAAVAQMVERLRQVNANLLGVVVVDVRRILPSYGAGYYERDSYEQGLAHAASAPAHANGKHANGKHAHANGTLNPPSPSQS